MDRQRKPNRLYEYDYSSDGLYFVTSCVHDKVCCFGEIIDEDMHLNECGKIAEEKWLWLGKQYPYIFLHSFVIMPNHMHGIIEIDKHYKPELLEQMIVGTDHDLSLQRDLSLDVQGKPIKIKSLSELMGAYKTTSSKKIHLTGYNDFFWHRSFHDHIIRDAKSLENITII